MEQKYDKVKKILKREFEWLLNKYPLSEFKNVELKVYNSADYNKAEEFDDGDEYGIQDIDAFVTEVIEKDEISFCIFIIHSSLHEPDYTDQMVLNKWEVRIDDLVYWMLYHEYGHLYHMRQLLNEGGVARMDKFREECSELVDNIIIKREEKAISKEEMDEEYRELWFEKFADEFANDIYQQRMQELFLIQKMDF